MVRFNFVLVVLVVLVVVLVLAAGPAEAANAARTVRSPGLGMLIMAIAAMITIWQFVKGGIDALRGWWNPTRRTYWWWQDFRDWLTTVVVFGILGAAGAVLALVAALGR